MTHKQLTRGLFVVLFILSGFIYYHLFFAAPQLVYVDSNRLLENYDGMKSARQAFQQKAAQWQANIDTLRSELEVEIRKFDEEKSRLSPKELELSQKLIDTKRRQFADYQKGIQQKSQQEDYQMTEQVLTEVNTFIETYAQRHGYSVILGASNGNVVYAKEALDITEELQQALNDNYQGF